MISTRAAYSFHGVAYLAHRAADAPVPFPDILEFLAGVTSGLTLSPGYISKVFQDLSRSGLVRAVPGRKGGYALARDPKEILLSDVLMAVDGQPKVGCCVLSVGSCASQSSCAVHQVVRKAESSFYGFLAGESAASLARKIFSGRARGKASGRGASRKKTGRKATKTTTRRKVAKKTSRGRRKTTRAGR